MNLMKYFQHITFLLNFPRSKEQEELAADQKQAQAQNQFNANSGKEEEQPAYDAGNNNLLDIVKLRYRKYFNFI